MYDKSEIMAASIPDYRLLYILIPTTPQNIHFLMLRYLEEVFCLFCLLQLTIICIMYEQQYLGSSQLWSQLNQICLGQLVEMSSSTCSINSPSTSWGILPTWCESRRDSSTGCTWFFDCNVIQTFDQIENIWRNV